MGKNGVDGVYDADPRTNPDACKFDTITFDEVLRGPAGGRRRRVQPLLDNDLPIVVFDLMRDGQHRAGRRAVRRSARWSLPADAAAPVTRPRRPVSTDAVHDGEEQT